VRRGNLKRNAGCYGRLQHQCALLFAMTTKNEQNDKYEFTVAVTIPGKDKNDNYYTRCAFVRGHRLSADGASNSATNTSIYVEHLMRRASTGVLLVDSDKLKKLRMPIRQADRVRPDHHR